MRLAWTYVKKFPGLNVSMACRDSSPNNSCAARSANPIAKPSPQAVMPSPTKLNLHKIQPVSLRQFQREHINCCLYRC